MFGRTTILNGRKMSFDCGLTEEEYNSIVITDQDNNIDPDSWDASDEEIEHLYNAMGGSDTPSSTPPASPKTSVKNAATSPNTATKSPIARTSTTPKTPVKSKNPGNIRVRVDSADNSPHSLRVPKVKHLTETGKENNQENKDAETSKDKPHSKRQLFGTIKQLNRLGNLSGSKLKATAKEFIPSTEPDAQPVQESTQKENTPVVQQWVAPIAPNSDTASKQIKQPVEYKPLFQSHSKAIGNSNYTFDVQAAIVRVLLKNPKNALTALDKLQPLTALPKTPVQEYEFNRLLALCYGQCSEHETAHYYLETARSWLMHLKAHYDSHHANVVISEINFNLTYGELNTLSSVALASRDDSSSFFSRPIM